MYIIFHISALKDRLCVLVRTTSAHNLCFDLIKEKLTELIEQTFSREGSHYLACNKKRAFFKKNTFGQPMVISEGL